jgi:hypothetical protein
MPYAEVPDVTTLSPFPEVGESGPNDPKVAEDTVRKWIQLRSSELDLLLRLKAIEVPVTTPAELVDLLRMAVTYGAAAMLSNAPVIQLQNGGTQNVYLQEYLRIKDWLEERTAAELLGANLIPDPAPVAPAPPSLRRSRNRRVSGDYCDPWYNFPPVRYTGNHGG